MTERFTEVLRRASEPTWSQAVQHRFVTELFAGTIPDRVMAGYLIQDHRFLDSFLTLLGAAIVTADSFKARLCFGRFVGMVSGDENTYFLRAFEALDISENSAPKYRTPSRRRASVSRCVFFRLVEWKKTGAAAQETARVAISVSDMTAAE